ncbi:MAG: AAA family ATPase [Actinomycetota bacterium]|nr:AAA family ATPase [Actinomycetota bacterium]
MRLSRIEAVRFGGVDGRTLDGLGDGLTVVVGPNEAGKTSFTTLVRHVLYGFPTPSKPRAYVSAAGSREGRLVFADPEGEWVLQRTEGPRGGQLAVRTLSGSERPDLAEELTRGVSEAAFGAVFGFGLAEMDEIERMRGSHDDIVSRLYAAGAGLAVSPQDVRATVDDRAAKLFALRGKNPTINALLGEIREMRDRVRTLEVSAEEYASDVEHLGELRAEIERATTARDAALERHRALAFDAGRVGDWEREIETAEVELAEADSEIARLDMLAEALVSGSDASAPVVEAEAVLGEAALFEQRFRAVRDRESRLREAEREASAALADLGMSRELALAADISPQTAAEIETRRDRLVRLEERTESLRSRLLEVRETAGGRAVGPTAGSPWPAVLLAVLGLLLAAYATVSADVTLGALGVVVLVAGAAFVLSRSRASAGAGTAPVSADAADATAGELQTARAEWAAWIRDRGFPDSVGDPGSAATLLAALKDVRGRLREAENLASDIAEEAAWLETYRVRLAAVAEPLGTGAPASLDTVSACAVGVRSSLEAAARLVAEKEDLKRARESAAARIAAIRTRIGASSERVQVALDRNGVTDSAALQGAVGIASAASDEAIVRNDALTCEASAITERVRCEEREKGMASLRLDITGAEERIRRSAEEYAIYTVASRMLERAQERYEREQQPEVVREAGRIFARITGDRYPRLKVPLDSSPIAVFDSAADERRTDHLSRGTAEQLYLALRLALLSQLGEVGVRLPVLMDDVLVNFDPERRRGAAEAIVDVARQRQIIVFTCHPETAALLADVDPGRTEVSLDRC